MLNDVKLDLTARSGKLGDYGADAFRLVKVDTSAQEDIWTVLISTWHPLGAQKMVGPRIKYLIYLYRQPIGAMSYISGMVSLGPRDTFIGWDKAQRSELLSHVICQNRFLLCPWISIRFLASHILNRSLKQVRIDWMDKYKKNIFFCETFVDATRYQGTCYRAAGWTELGKTQGYGREKNKIVYHGNRKYIFVRVLDKRFLRTIRRNASVS